VEYLHCPAGIGPALEQEAIHIAQAVIEAFDICGLLAVEMFLTTNGDLLINEVAPRPHNSGHHTIEACNASQYEQHLRAILNMPLVDIRLKSPAVMINLLGEPGFSGHARYRGLQECLKVNGAHIHLYGKMITKPWRKMGHVTVVAENMEMAREKAKFVKDTLKVVA
jgi:5-(carboxyamino)imidazole ribonucleotide synthase